MSRLHKLDPNFKPAFNGPELAHSLVQKLNETASKLNKPIEFAYLFGSASVGKNSVDSDLDILVVVSDHYSNDIPFYYSIVNQPFFSPVAVDWIFMSSSDFNLKKEDGGVARIAYVNGMRVL